jgi:hypothetical protein
MQLIAAWFLALAGGVTMSRTPKAEDEPRPPVP